jgi:hypothetical protein
MTQCKFGLTACYADFYGGDSGGFGKRVLRSHRSNTYAVDFPRIVVHIWRWHIVVVFDAIWSTAPIYSHGSKICD